MSMDEKDLTKLAREQSEDIQIPDSLQPEQIEHLLESRGKKKKKQYYGKLMAAAACGLLVIGVAAVGANGLGLDTGAKSDSIEYQTAAESGAVSEEKTQENQASGAAQPFEVTEIKTAENYDEVYAYIEAENKRLQEMQKDRKSVV